jgi:hypothetical protein
MKKPIIISLSRRFIWSVVAGLFVVGFTFGVKQAKSEQIEALVALRVSDMELKEFRCEIKTLGGTQVTYALPPESSISFVADCRKIFNDSFD